MLLIQVEVSEARYELQECGDQESMEQGWPRANPMLLVMVVDEGAAEVPLAAASVLVLTLESACLEVTLEDARRRCAGVATPAADAPVGGQRCCCCCGQ